VKGHFCSNVFNGVHPDVLVLLSLVLSGLTLLEFADQDGNKTGEKTILLGEAFFYRLL